MLRITVGVFALISQRNKHGKNALVGLLSKAPKICLFVKLPCLVSKVICVSYVQSSENNEKKKEILLPKYLKLCLNFHTIKIYIHVLLASEFKPHKPCLCYRKVMLHCKLNICL